MSITKKHKQFRELQKNNPGALIVILRSVGNPDFRQYAPISPEEISACYTLQDAIDLCKQYIEEWTLGGGNWAGGQVYDGSDHVADISYNGRVWHPGNITKLYKN